MGRESARGVHARKRRVRSIIKNITDELGIYFVF